jgi:hypothetical protein
LRLYAGHLRILYKDKDVQVVTGIDMATRKQPSVDGVRAVIGGMALIVLWGISAPLGAQTVGEVAVAKPNSSLVDLPDAPVPTTRAGKDTGTAAPETGESSSIQNGQQQDQQQDKPQDKPQTKPGEQLPPPPAGTLTLGDLGLTPEEIAGNKRQQELLDKRTEMLKIHQRLGLITLIPVAAACISSVGAPPEHGNYGNTTSRDVHVAIGGTAVAFYAATAYFAIRAPKVSNEPARGGIKLHKYLIYLHAPGMVLTPILGAMAFNQINSGQKVHGIASAHGAVAVVTAASYGAAIIAVSWPIHLKF